MKFEESQKVWRARCRVGNEKVCFYFEGEATVVSEIDKDKWTVINKSSPFVYKSRKEFEQGDKTLYLSVYAKEKMHEEASKNTTFPNFYA